MAMARVAEIRTPHTINWSVLPIDRLIIDDTSSFVRELVPRSPRTASFSQVPYCTKIGSFRPRRLRSRSEEHTSELQSRLHLVCRLLLEKKKKQHIHHYHYISAQKNQIYLDNIHSLILTHSATYMYMSFFYPPYCCTSRSQPAHVSRVPD